MGSHVNHTLRRATLAGLVAFLMLGEGCSSVQPSPQDLARQVADTERAFARSMATRDHAAFIGHLSEQAVFYGDGKVLKGKAAVALEWKPFFDGAEAPFSWEPDQVDVLADGPLECASVPVRDARGTLIARFNSVWRQEGRGVWRIVFDKGSPLSASERKAAGS
jgi:ketosteroid isomerase-like protein